MPRFTSTLLVFALVAALGLGAGCGGGGGTGGGSGSGGSGSTNADLVSLALSAGRLTPGFDAATAGYTVDVGLFAASITVVPTAADAGATIRVDGIPVLSAVASHSIALPVGSTPISIDVTASDGVTQRTYTVVVNRAGGAAQQAYLKASNTDMNDGFGLALALAGDTLVVGVVGEDSNATGVNGNDADNSATNAGAAFVFVRSGVTWTQQAYLKASNTEASDRFGFSVAMSGNTIVVGANEEDSNATGIDGDQSNNGALGAGAAYVFVRSGSTWSQEAYLKASNTDAGDEFGYDVAISGDTLVVGARVESSNATGVNGNQADNSAAATGAAYVFVRSGSTWGQEAYLKASNGESGDTLGDRVEISGDTIVVSAPFEDSAATGVNGNEADNSAIRSGAAYVFVRNGTVWSQQAYLKASNTDAQDLFALRLALFNDTLAVGTSREDSAAVGIGGDQLDNSADNAGAAYVFVRSGGSWSQQAYLKASNADAFDGFGGAVALCGDTLAVGSAGESSSAIGVGGNQFDNSAATAGAAYVFVRSGTTWTQQAYVKASNTEAGDQFGGLLDLSGDTLVASAWEEDSNATGVGGDQANNAAAASGAAYVIR